MAEKPIVPEVRKQPIYFEDKPPQTTGKTNPEFENEALKNVSKILGSLGEGLNKHKRLEREGEIINRIYERGETAEMARLSMNGFSPNEIILADKASTSNILTQITDYMNTFLEENTTDATRIEAIKAAFIAVEADPEIAGLIKNVSPSQRGVFNANLNNFKNKTLANSYGRIRQNLSNQELNQIRNLAYFNANTLSGASETAIVISNSRINGLNSEIKIYSSLLMGISTIIAEDKEGDKPILNYVDDMGETPVPLLDEEGKPVLNAEGERIMTLLANNERFIDFRNSVADQIDKRDFVAVDEREQKSKEVQLVENALYVAMKAKVAEIRLNNPKKLFDRDWMLNLFKNEFQVEISAYFEKIPSVAKQDKWYTQLANQALEAKTISKDEFGALMSSISNSGLSTSQQRAKYAEVNVDYLLSASQQSYINKFITDHTGQHSDAVALMGGDRNAIMQKNIVDYFMNPLFDHLIATEQIVSGTIRTIENLRSIARTDPKLDQTLVNQIDDGLQDFLGILSSHWSKVDHDANYIKSVLSDQGLEGNQTFQDLEPFLQKLVIDHETIDRLKDLLKSIIPAEEVRKLPTPIQGLGAGSPGSQGNTKPKPAVVETPTTAVVETPTTAVVETPTRPSWRIKLDIESANKEIISTKKHMRIASSGGYTNLDPATDEGKQKIQKYRDKLLKLGEELKELKAELLELNNSTVGATTRTGEVGKITNGMD